MLSKKIKNSFLLLLLFIAPALLAQSNYNLSSINSVIENNQRSLGKNFVVLIYKDGKIIYQKADGSFTLQTQEPIASCSKWLTAALVMTFIDEGKLSINDKVSQYLPAFATNGKNNITIKDCLSQQTGIHQEPIKLFKLMTQKKYETLEDEVNAFAKREQDFTSGSGFYYGNVGLNIAARVIEVIGKKDFSTLMKERILNPLEMNNTSFDKNNKAPNPSGGAVSTANDYMNFLIMLLDKGEFNGKKVLSQKAIKMMQQTQTSLDKIKYAPKVAEGFNYAFGSWVQETDTNGKPTVITCPGLFGTWPLIDINRDYACLFFVKSILGENKADAYLSIKKTIDTALSK